VSEGMREEKRRLLWQSDQVIKQQTSSMDSI